MSLKVVSVLHHLSIKRAIQILRMNNFEPNCLRRRPSDEVLLQNEVTKRTSLGFLCLVFLILPALLSSLLLISLMIFFFL